MKKILFLTNCQGFEYNLFLRAGSGEYLRDWHFLKTIQAQSIKASDAPFLLAQMEQADAVVAQPLFSTPIEALRPAALRALAQRMGKHFVTLPALQYDALIFGTVPTRWGGMPGYPFAANENMVIAAAYLRGIGAQAAAELYHDAPLLDPQQLRARVETGIAAFQEREAEAGLDIIASTYYAAQWRNSRLHFAKGHPLPDVMRHFTAALAARLGIADFDPGATHEIKGFFEHSMPVPRWVKTGLGLTFQSADDTVCCGGKYMPLDAFIQIMFDWYDMQGPDEVARRVGGEKPFLRARNAAALLG